MHTDVAVVAFGAQHNHAVVVTNLNVVTRQLTAEVGGTLARFATHKGSQGHQEVGIVMRHIFCAETMGVVFGNEACVEIASHKFGVSQQSRLEWNVGTDTANDKSIESFAHFGDGIVAVSAMHDQFGNHGVVEHGDLATILHASVHAHTQQVLRVGLEHGLHGRLETHQTACRRQEIAEGIFGVDTALNGPAVALHISLRDRQFLAVGHANHHLHQVYACNGFGDRVLHLQTRVHLQEVKALVFAHHKLHSACRLVLHRFGQGHRLLTHGYACGIADER